MVVFICLFILNQNTRCHLNYKLMNVWSACKPSMTYLCMVLQLTAVSWERERWLWADHYNRIINLSHGTVLPKWPTFSCFAFRRLILFTIAGRREWAHTKEFFWVVQMAVFTNECSFKLVLSLFPIPYVKFSAEGYLRRLKQPICTGLVCNRSS